MSKFVDISAALVTTLGGVAGLGEVKNYPSSKFDTYPAASVFTSGNTNSFLDSASNFVTHLFTIRIVDEYKTDPAGSEARMLALADEIIDVLDQSDGLGGVVALLQPASITAGFSTSELGEYRIYQLDVQASCSSTI